jgi:hypothetical protein
VASKTKRDKREEQETRERGERQAGTEGKRVRVDSIEATCKRV